jgi:hypothetical protein
MDEEELLSQHQVDGAQPLSLTLSPAPVSPDYARGRGAGKRPRPIFEEEDSDEDLLPAVADFFDDFDTPVDQRISICRAYASYLASLKKRKKGGKK